MIGLKDSQRGMFHINGIRINVSKYNNNRKSSVYTLKVVLYTRGNEVQ